MIFGGSQRVALVGVFAFLSHNFGKVAGTYEWYFVSLWLVSTLIGDRDTQTLTAVIEFV